MKQCPFCMASIGEDKPVCQACQKKLKDGQHPVLCAGCYGPAVWLDRKSDMPQLKEVLDTMERVIEGQCGFVRLSCPRCAT